MDRHIIILMGKLRTMGFSGTLFQSYAQISSTVPAACASLCPSDSSGAPQAGPRLEIFLLAHPTHTHLEKKQNPVRRNNLQKIYENIECGGTFIYRKAIWKGKMGMVNKKRMPYFQPNLQCRANLYLQWFPHGRRPELNIGAPYSNHSNPVRWDPQTYCSVHRTTSVTYCGRLRNPAPPGTVESL